MILNKKNLEKSDLNVINIMNESESYLTLKNDYKNKAQNIEYDEFETTPN